MKRIFFSILLAAGATIFAAEAAAAPTLPPSVVSCEEVSTYDSLLTAEMKAEDGTKASQNLRRGMSATDVCDVVVQLAIKLQVPQIRQSPTVVLLGSKLATFFGSAMDITYGPDTCTTLQDVGLPNLGPAQLTDLTPLEIGRWLGLSWQRQESQTPLTLHYYKFDAELIVVAMLQNECVMHARKTDFAQLWTDVNRIREGR